MPRKVIFMIGDGMGLPQIHAAMAANENDLYIAHMPYVGLAKTYSTTSYITDSGASGTALSSGVKTYNGAVGVDSTGSPVQSLLQIAEAKKWNTAVVVTSEVGHATPASFLAHNTSRRNYEDISIDIARSGVDVLVGGGRVYFDQRSDERNIITEMVGNGYTFYDALDPFLTHKTMPVFTLVADKGLPRGRDMTFVPRAVKKTLELLHSDKSSFFMMVEGSQIDWGGHANDTEYVLEQLYEFDKAVAEVLRYAMNDPDVLVVITADHETGGMSVFRAVDGSVETSFSTDGHTSVMVPVFAYGAGASLFSGVYENTEVFHKIKTLCQW